MVAGNGVTESGQYVTEIPEVTPPDDGVARQRKFEDGKSASRFADPGHLRQPPFSLSDVPQPEGNRDEVKGRIGKGEIHGIGLHPLDREAPRPRLLHTAVKHRQAEVAGNYANPGASFRCVGERQITRSRADVKDGPGRWRGGPTDSHSPPPDVDAAGEHPVDGVVSRRDLGEHAANLLAALVDWWCGRGGDCSDSSDFQTPLPGG